MAVIIFLTVTIRNAACATPLQFFMLGVAGACVFGCNPSPATRVTLLLRVQAYLFTAVLSLFSWLHIFCGQPGCLLIWAPLLHR